MNLNVDDWKDILLYDYFDIEAGKYYYTDKYNEGTTPYYSASNENNGIGSYIDLPPDFDGNKIVTGKIGCTAFYAPKPFCATSDVNIFKPKFNMSLYAGLFIVNIINFSENYKWAYGRQCRVGNSQRIRVKLPVTPDGKPDWRFMEDYIKSLYYKPLTTKNKYSGSLDLNVQKWGEFTIPELFGEVVIAKSADIGNLEDGLTPFVGRTDIDNGVQGSVKPIYITKGNCITISMVGTNVALFQENDFQASQNIAILRKDGITKAAALFICSVINFEMALKYSYGRTVGKANIEQMVLKLPITSENEPDWQFMEKYIKALPYGDRLMG